MIVQFLSLLVKQDFITMFLNYSVSSSDLILKKEKKANPKKIRMFWLSKQNLFFLSNYFELVLIPFD